MEREDDSDFFVRSIMMVEDPDDDDDDDGEKDEYGNGANDSAASFRILFIIERCQEFPRLHRLRLLSLLCVHPEVFHLWHTDRTILWMRQQKLGQFDATGNHVAPFVKIIITLARTWNRVGIGVGSRAWGIELRLVLFKL